MITKENEQLINEYLDIAVNASEDYNRFVGLLDDECVWNLMPPGISLQKIESIKKFVDFAMKSRTHNNEVNVVIKNWFADNDNFCVEYFHGAFITKFKIRVIENVCLVCKMKNGKFTRINEYVDTSSSILILCGLKLLKLICKIKKIKYDKTCKFI